MYNWLAGMAGINAFSDGVDWDGHLEVMWEAYRAAVLPIDRARLRALIAAIEWNRGERVDEMVGDIAATIGESTDRDDRFIVHMVSSNAAMATGDGGRAFREAIAAADLQNQSPEVALAAALTAAVASRDPELVRDAADRVARLPRSGALAQAQLREAEGALAAVEGRGNDALAAFGDARRILLNLGVRWDAAMVVLRQRPHARRSVIRASAAEARPLWSSSRDRDPRLLDAALAAGQDSAATSSTRVSDPLPVSTERN